MKAKSSARQALADKGQIKKIHVLSSRLELPDDLYRKWLDEHYKVASSKQLTVDQARDFIRLLEHFAVQCGYWDHDPNKEKYNELAGRPGMATPAQLRMVESMWVELTRPETEEERDATLRGFLRKRYNISDLRFLTLESIDKVIHGLRVMKERGWQASRKMPQDASEGI
ncbi:MAG: regulatory protein GemA [Syntrophorhabdales bacterium]|jgi:hypothetical protein